MLVIGQSGQPPGVSTPALPVRRSVQRRSILPSQLRLRNDVHKGLMELESSSEAVAGAVEYFPVRTYRTSESVDVAQTFALRQWRELDNCREDGLLVLLPLLPAAI